MIVAEAPDLPGCLTQGATFEEARANLLDTIEVWLMSGLRSGEDPPVVNGFRAWACSREWQGARSQEGRKLTQRRKDRKENPMIVFLALFAPLRDCSC